MEDDGVLEMVRPHWGEGGWGLWWWIPTGVEDKGFWDGGTLLGLKRMGCEDGGISMG